MDRPSDCVCDFYQGNHRDYCPVYEEQFYKEVEKEQKIDELWDEYLLGEKIAYGRWYVSGSKQSEEEWEETQLTFEEFLENEGFVM